jgi:hypothetical protein
MNGWTKRLLTGSLLTLFRATPARGTNLLGRQILGIICGMARMADILLIHYYAMKTIK